MLTNLNLFFNKHLLLSSNHNMHILQNIDHAQLFYWSSCMQTTRKGWTITSTRNTNIFVHFWNFFQLAMYICRKDCAIYRGYVQCSRLKQVIIFFLHFYILHTHIKLVFLIISLIPSDESGWFLMNVFIRLQIRNRNEIF